ncbi:hypothetical protein J7444_04065 [Labrenzia sp. R4_1]|uniref:hypothetical protein n=1 Tax=unclassified Labrenzia TaxID=2648686 RepID=UPI001ADAAEA3|nr:MULTISPECIES: hypothetical protein [unclassified Labrenzia]MBO9417892.1 hypothetical protein [Labrenzia sp. R4_2]MBO9423880.1 hypothetical protein [Labrenzia sp. R4_1]
MRDTTMDTKAKCKTDGAPDNATGRDHFVKGLAVADQVQSQMPHRSIRDMVIDNNERFAATMKSLGE